MIWDSSRFLGESINWCNHYNNRARRIELCSALTSLVRRSGRIAKQGRILDLPSDINRAKTFERYPCRRDTQQLMRFQGN